MHPPAAAVEQAIVLLIDDDAEMALLLGRLFQRERLVLRSARTIREGLAQYRSEPPSVLILDLMLPDGRGLDVCRQLRAASPLLPILILTARGDPMDRVLGLELGADDYLAKPFESRELLARVRALLRRQDAAAAQSPAVAQRIEVGALVLDLGRLAATLHGRALELTASELRLLTALAQQPGEPLTREQLAAAVQPVGYRPLERAVDVQIGRLRRKLGDDGERCIRTVRGAGYALVPPEASDGTGAGA
jgi:DNA-binding response OmpR family regulator